MSVVKITRFKINGIKLRRITECKLEKQLERLQMMYNLLIKSINLSTAKGALTPNKLKVTSSWAGGMLINKKFLKTLNMDIDQKQDLECL